MCDDYSNSIKDDEALHNIADVEIWAEYGFEGPWDWAYRYSDVRPERKIAEISAERDEQESAEARMGLA